MRDLGETVPRLRVRAGALLARGMLRAGDGPARRDDAAADLRAARAILEPIAANSEGQPAVCDLLDLAGAEAGLAALARERGDAREARTLLESAAARVKEALAVCPAHADALRARAKIEADLRTPVPRAALAPDPTGRSRRETSGGASPEAPQGLERTNGTTTAGLAVTACCRSFDSSLTRSNT
jgi:hypothetical protein